jgi:hypothetical protein
MIFGGKIAGRLLEEGSENILYVLVILCSFLPSVFIFLTKPRLAEESF